MDIQEIFIGAWVLLKINESNRILREPHRVTGIMTSDGQHYVQTDESNVYRGLECYEPIAITHDIMSASGFINDLGTAYYRQIDNSKWLDYYYPESRLREWYEGIDEWNNHAKVKEITFQCTCMYVHELQTALRLCGSEIEIII